MKSNRLDVVLRLFLPTPSKLPSATTRSFAFTIQDRAGWEQQARALSPEVAAEARQALNAGLLVAVVQLSHQGPATLDAPEQTMRIHCDRHEVSDAGELTLFSGSGLALAVFARSQWRSVVFERPSELLCRSEI